jgi:hypothetical protein
MNEMPYAQFIDSAGFALLSSLDGWNWIDQPNCDYLTGRYFYVSCVESEAGSWFAPLMSEGDGFLHALQMLNIQSTTVSCDVFSNIEEFFHHIQSNFPGRALVIGPVKPGASWRWQPVGCRERELVVPIVQVRNEDRILIRVPDCPFVSVTAKELWGAVEGYPGKTVVCCFSQKDKIWIDQNIWEKTLISGSRIRISQRGDYTIRNQGLQSVARSFFMGRVSSRECLYLYSALRSLSLSYVNIADFVWDGLAQYGTSPFQEKKGTLREIVSVYSGIVELTAYLMREINHGEYEKIARNIYRIKHLEERLDGLFANLNFDW